MGALNDIFEDYRSKRKSGMSSRTALETMANTIRGLSEKEKTLLKEQIKTWEEKVKSKANDKSSPNPAARITATMRAVLSPEGKAATTPLPDVPKIKCPNCGKNNPEDESICYSCGYVLKETNNAATQQLSSADQDFAFHHFTANSSLLLTARDTSESFELRPQDSPKEIVLGRFVANSPTQPDVDLTPAGGDHLGVSRSHMAIKYNADEKAIQIYDLGSSNGTYINGRKLHPKEVFVLRNGDDIRLGRLVMRATFNH